MLKAKFFTVSLCIMSVVLGAPTENEDKTKRFELEWNKRSTAQQKRFLAAFDDRFSKNIWKDYPMDDNQKRFEVTVKRFDISPVDSMKKRFDLDVADKRFDMDMAKRFDLSMDKRFDMDMSKKFDMDMDKRFDLSLDKRFDMDMAKRFDIGMDKRFDTDMNKRFDLAMTKRHS